MAMEFNFSNVHPSWHQSLQEALTKLDSTYLAQLKASKLWLPGHQKIFNAFSLPLFQVNYVLFGESPYPRAHSANGYAFWDDAVTNLWSEKGLSKAVNRATSLRNIMKMLLVAGGKLAPDDTSQPAIAALDKSTLIQTNAQLFNNLIKHGFLLLNASPVLQPTPVRLDARAWKPFLAAILSHLVKVRPNIQFVLLGNIANEIEPLITHSGLKKIYSEHPYNISFINNPTILDFFQPLRLLEP